MFVWFLLDCYNNGCCSLGQVFYEKVILISREFFSLVKLNLKNDDETQHRNAGLWVKQCVNSSCHEVALL